MMYTLESVCDELRLQRLPSLVNSVEGLTREEWLVNLLVHEVEAKEQRRIDRLIKQAKFSSIKTLEGFSSAFLNCQHEFYQKFRNFR